MKAVEQPLGDLLDLDQILRRVQVSEHAVASADHADVVQGVSQKIDVAGLSFIRP